MQLRNSKVIDALAAVAIAGAIPLIGGHSGEAVAATSTAPAWAIQPGGTLAATAGNGSDPVKVNFAKWGGTINFDPDSPGAAAIKIDVDLTGAAIGDAFKDELLQGDEFFGTSSNPTATYQSQSVEAQADGRYLVVLNAAYSPSCAYSPYYNCPIPPLENRLTVGIPAGESYPEEAH